MLILFDKVDRFIRVYDGTKYLVLSAPQKCDPIYNRVRYLIREKSGITFFGSILMLRFGKTKVSKEELHGVNK